MNVRRAWIVAVLILGLSMAVVSCGKKQQTAEDIAKAVSSTMVPTSAQNDYTQPYLTEEMMTKFIASMQEEKNPFELMFKQGGGMQSLSDIESKLGEYNAYAQKYGFKDYADYMAVWGRITVGQMVLWSEGMTKGTAEMYESTIKNAEEQLQKPDLNPEMKTIYEQQIADSRKALEDMKNEKSDSSLNAADLALVKQFKAQLDEAAKKYKQNPQ